MNTLKESCHKKTNIIHVSSEIARKLYYYVQWTGHFVCKQDFYINRKNFASYLMLYTLNGSGILNYRQKSYRLEKNSFMLIDCTDAHEYYPSGDGWEFKYIHFNGADSAKYYEHIVELFNSHVIDGVIDAEKYFDRIYDRVRTAGAEETCSEIIYHLLIKLIHLHGTEKQEKGDLFKLGDIMTNIAENYKNDISVIDLAEMAHMSRCHFSTEFKAQTGFTPYAYLLSYRLSAAKRALCNTDKTVEEISASCGFSDTSSLIRAFKRTEGVSPAAYRKKH